MAYFATEYTIHFDDTMAYGSHHFLTAFKLQCAARESFLFGESVYDVAGVRESLDEIQLVTADAYACNLNPARLGDRLAILLTLEEWGRVSARFCYRVLDSDGRPICAGFQTLICSDPETGLPVPIPAPLRDAMEAMREIEEPTATESFRHRVLGDRAQIDTLFGPAERETAVEFLRERYPSPRVIAPVGSFDRGAGAVGGPASVGEEESDEPVEAWIFSGQATFDPELLTSRIKAYVRLRPGGRDELDEAAAITGELIGGDAEGLLGEDDDRCATAVKNTPQLSQVAIYLQNVLGARLRESRGHAAAVLMGHSFGEIAALAVGGCFELLTGVRVVCERVRALEAYAPPGGGLLVVGDGRPLVATETSLIGLNEVVVAGRNHDRQTVASGPVEQLAQLRDYLQGIGVHAVKIASPTSFHHPRLRAAATAWLQKLRPLPLKGPASPVYTAIGRRFIGEHDDIAVTLASQLIRPFDLQGGLLDLVAAGVNRFIDCGSSGAMARIIASAAPREIEVHGAEHEDGERHLGGSAGDPQRARASDGVAEQSIGGAATAGAATRPSDTSVSHPPIRRERPANGHARPQVRRSAQQEIDRPRRPAIAIVGQGCILPGGATSPERLYSALEEQRMGIVDQRRYDPHWSEDFFSEKLVADRSTSHLMGRVEDADIVVPPGVDPQVFASFTRTQQLLSIALAPCIESMRHAERVLCLIGATADGFEDQDVVSSLQMAGIDPTDREVDERLDSARSASQDPHGAIQEVFDRVVRPGLEVTLIDAACASSLYSIALGRRVLESGKADVVIAGGVFCPGPGNSCLFSQFQGMTSTGCRPFDAGADGVVFSEGAALVALCRASHAEKAELPVSAVVRGEGLSSDGRSSSANVPQTRGQILSLERCYATYGIDRGSIQAIEAHGTSTPVGDSTELETLRSFFAENASRPIPVHSLKGLLGHAGWAAGAASVIAACEYLRLARFPAQAGYRNPSPGLIKASDTLTVPTQPLPLPAPRRRIAVDGFGFGGANAHVVLDSHADADDVLDVPDHQPLPAATELSGSDEELVFVAWHELTPTVVTPTGRRFDRDTTKVPSRHILLPDLADDIDISQTLTISLVDAVLAKLPQFPPELQRDTGIVLAQPGKTERGIEATMRVLASRFRRNLAGLARCTEKLDAALERTRPSGPYTLQCMMPNVSSGRAALLLDLNGPNFVVDSGSKSFEVAMDAASLLLGSGDKGGTRLVVVAAVDASSQRIPGGDPQQHEDEYAAAFAVTTRRNARELGLEVLAEVDGCMQTACEERGLEHSTQQKIRSLLAIVDGGGDPSATEPSRDDSAVESASSSGAGSATKFPIHESVWVESAATFDANDRSVQLADAVVVVAPADPDMVAELATILPGRSRKFIIVAVGSRATRATFGSDARHVVLFDPSDNDSHEDFLARIAAFEADLVIAIDSVTSWDLRESMDRVAAEPLLCETMFLVAQRYAERLKQGAVQLWGLFHDGWNGVVHPASGAVVGMFKSIQCEMRATRTGTICTRGLSLAESLQCVRQERHQKIRDPEIVYDGQRRLVRRLRPCPPEAGGAARVKLDSNSVVVATGGARGVTAILLDAILREHHCTVIALGRSRLETGPAEGSDEEVERQFYDRYLREHPSAPPLEMKERFERARASSEAHQTIERLASLGGRVEYLAADVTDPDQVERAVREIADKYGRIDLLVHGAGVQFSKRLEQRSLAEFQKTFSTKVGGLRNLIDSCDRHFGKGMTKAHLLTSAYSVFGNDGQHDYGAANETLDRLCGLRGNGSDWTSIAWLAWDGIGMTRGSEYRALAKQRGLSGLTAADGRHILGEVLSGRTGSAVNIPLSETEHVRYEVRTIPAPRGKPGRVKEVPVRLADFDCLQHHRVQEKPTLPGAWILDCLIQAGMQLLGDEADRVDSVSVRDVAFMRFVRMSGEREPNLRIIVEETADGISAWMIGDVLHPSGVALARDQVFAEATLQFNVDAPMPESSLHEIAGMAVDGNGTRFVEDPYCEGQGRDVHLSGPFNCLREIMIGPAGRRATFFLEPQFSSPSLLLDAAWRTGAMYAVPDPSELYVPFRIGRLVLPAGANASLGAVSGWEIRSSAPILEGRGVRWDRTEVLDEDGSVRLVVFDISATRLA